MLSCPAAFRDVRAVVAIPVKDEVERIADCLLALDRQADPPGVVLLVNNTTDGTMRAIADVRPSLGFPVHAVERRFPAALANAGEARRVAMQLADRWAPPDVALLTTDADGRVAPDWLDANLHHLRRGLDAVFGRAEIDATEAARIPPALHQADAAECAYAALLDEIESLLDPDPDDPWPRHTEHSGASIAVARQAFTDVGGIPPVPLGEDRAFHLALRRSGKRIRHAPEVRVVVSGRILGRAAGGMADTIRRRLIAPDTMLDDALEPARDRVRRVRMRRAAYTAFAAGDGASLDAIGAAAGLGGMGPSGLEGQRFGALWAEMDAGLPRRRVPVGDVGRQTAIAVAMRDALRARVGPDGLLAAAR